MSTEKVCGRGCRVVRSRLSNVRPEFRRLLRDLRYRLAGIAKAGGVTTAAISSSITRGGLSELVATRIERNTRGKYRAHLLVRR